MVVVNDFFVLTELVVRNLASQFPFIYVKTGYIFHFQQTLLKKKYDFSKANRIIREVNKSLQREKTDQFPAQESGLPSNKSDSKALDDKKEVNLTETLHNVTDSSEMCSHQDNIKGVLEAQAENRSEDTNSGLQNNENNNSSVGNDNPCEIVAEKTETERNHSLSGAVTDDGEIRIRPEERKHVSLCLMTFYCLRK